MSFVNASWARMNSILLEKVTFTALWIARHLFRIAGVWKKFFFDNQSYNLSIKLIRASQCSSRKESDDTHISPTSFNSKSELKTVDCQEARIDLVLLLKVIHY